MENKAECDLLDSDIETPKHHDLMWWRKVMYRLKEMHAERTQRQDVLKNIVDTHNDAINKNDVEIENFEKLIKGWLENSPFTTKTGFKVDQPDIGSITLSKPRSSYNVTDKEYWIDKGFTRIAKPELNKIELNEHLKQYNIVGKSLVSTETGEIVKGVEVTYQNKLKVRV